MDFENVNVTTERLILRAFRFEDKQGLFELDSDPKVHKYLGNHPISEINECVSDIKQVRQQYKDNGLGRWIILDKNTGDLIGWSGLKLEKHIREFHYYDLGYRIKPKYWGKGIATESAIASLKYGFKQMNLEKICAAAHKENIASNKVLEKVGFAIKETFEFDGGNHNWYEIRKEDWNSDSKDK